MLHVTSDGERHRRTERVEHYKNCVFWGGREVDSGKGRISDTLDRNSHVGSNVVVVDVENLVRLREHTEALRLLRHINDPGHPGEVSCVFALRWMPRSH